MVGNEISPVQQVTALLHELTATKPATLSKLLEATQAELRRLARRERRSLQASDTLSTTALFNELYLKLHAADLPEFADRKHFYSVAARAMRQIIIDYARSRLAGKRGGGRHAEPLSAANDVSEDVADAERAIELNNIIDRLEELNPRLAQVVCLRFYAGLSDAEIGVIIDRDESTVRRDWLKARGWLFEHLTPNATKT